MGWQLWGCTGLAIVTPAHVSVWCDPSDEVRIGARQLTECVRSALAREPVNKSSAALGVPPPLHRRRIRAVASRLQAPTHSHTMRPHAATNQSNARFFRFAQSHPFLFCQ